MGRHLRLRLGGRETPGDTWGTFGESGVVVPGPTSKTDVETWKRRMVGVVEPSGNWRDSVSEEGILYPAVEVVQGQRRSDVYGPLGVISDVE